MSEEVKTLGHEFPKEQARLRDLLVIYEKIGAPGVFAAAMIRDTLARADRAAIEGDVVAMIRIYEEMRGVRE